MVSHVVFFGPKVDRTFALIQRLSEPLDEALCSQAVEAAIRTSRPQLANSFMETRLGAEIGHNLTTVMVRPIFGCFWRNRWDVSQGEVDDFLLKMLGRFNSGNSDVRTKEVHVFVGEYDWLHCCVVLIVSKVSSSIHLYIKATYQLHRPNFSQTGFKKE